MASRSDRIDSMSWKKIVDRSKRSAHFRAKALAEGRRLLRERVHGPQFHHTKEPTLEEVDLNFSRHIKGTVFKRTSMWDLFVSMRRETSYTSPVRLNSLIVSNVEERRVEVNANGAKHFRFGTHQNLSIYLNDHAAFQGVESVETLTLTRTLVKGDLLCNFKNLKRAIFLDVHFEDIHVEIKIEKALFVNCTFDCITTENVVFKNTEHICTIGSWFGHGSDTSVECEREMMRSLFPSSKQHISISDFIDDADPFNPSYRVFNITADKSWRVDPREDADFGKYTDKYTDHLKNTVIVQPCQNTFLWILPV